MQPFGRPHKRERRERWRRIAHRGGRGERMALLCSLLLLGVILFI
jgi:hypothetical protein